jgi:hypothetical protein
LGSVKTRIAGPKDGKRAVKFLEHLEARDFHTLHVFVGKGFIHLMGLESRLCVNPPFILVNCGSFVLIYRSKLAVLCMFRIQSSRAAPLILGLLLVASALTFIGTASATPLPAGCTSSSPGTATCSYTFYAAQAASTSSQCDQTVGGSVQLPALDTSVPSAGTAYLGFCTVYSGPDIDITSVTANVYLGAPSAPFSSDNANLYSASNVNALDVGSGSFIAGTVLSSNLGDGSGSCGAPFTFAGVNLPVSGGSFSLTTGAALIFVPNFGAEGVVCTGQTAGGQDTPTSFTITGTLAAAAVTTTTSTTTSTVTSTYFTTSTAEVTVGQTTTTTITLGACTPQPHSPASAVEQVAAQMSPAPTTTTYTVTDNATTTTTSTTTFTATATDTITRTTEVMVFTCTTLASTSSSSSANGVPQFPIPNLSALVLVALLLPIVVLMARARKSNAPALSA